VNKIVDIIDLYLFCLLFADIRAIIYVYLYLSTVGLTSCRSTLQ